MIRPMPLAVTVGSLMVVLAGLYGWAAHATDIYVVLGQSLLAWCF